MKYSWNLPEWLRPEELAVSSRWEQSRPEMAASWLLDTTAHLLVWSTAVTLVLAETGTLTLVRCASKTVGMTLDVPSWLHARLLSMLKKTA